MPKTSKPTRSHISESSIALKLAEQMNNYFTIHSDSLRIVQQDPVKFDQETRNFKSSPNAITSLDPNFFADGKAQIAIYDDILKKEPVSYEDYFYRAQYALSAAFLFNHFVVAEKLEDETFENQFWGEVDRRQLEYQQEHYPGAIPEDVETPKYNLPVFEPAPSSLTSLAPVEHLKDPHQLFKKVFLLSDGAIWKVDKMVMDRDGACYWIHFDGLAPCPMAVEDLEVLLRQSSLTGLCSS